MVKLKFNTVINLNSKCRSGIKKSVHDLYSCNKSLNYMSSIMIIDNKEHKYLLNENITYILIKNYYFIHNNNLIWNKLHNIFNIEIKQSLKNNVVVQDYNEIIKKTTKHDILNIISEIKKFSNR